VKSDFLIGKITINAFSNNCCAMYLWLGFIVESAYLIKGSFQIYEKNISYIMRG